MIRIPSSFDNEVSEVIEHAVRIAESMGHHRLGTPHVLIALRHLEDPLTMRLIGDIRLEAVQQAVEKCIGCMDDETARVENVTSRLKEIFDSMQAYDTEGNHPGVKHLWLEMLDDKRSETSDLLKPFKKSRQALRQTISDVTGDVADLPKKTVDAKAEQVAHKTVAPDKDGVKKAPPEHKKGAAAKVQELEKYARNLVQAARQHELEPLIGREEELDAMVRVLGKKLKNNPLLIGEPGVGKSALAGGLAQRIAEGSVPAPMADLQVYELDMTRLLAGTRYRGDFEERIQNVIDCVQELSNVILFIDEVHTLISAGGNEGGVNAANILKPALARGKMRVIGATTYKEYRKYVERDAALTRRFQRIDVDEPTKGETLRILGGLKPRYEEYHHVKITDDAIASAVELSARYVTDRFMPDKAIDLIDEASSMAKIDACAENAARDGVQEAEIVIDTEQVAKIISTWTGIPLDRMSMEETQDSSTLEARLSARIIGQENAVKTITRALRRAQAGLTDPNRPMGVFMLLGPSGVGKTELCKVLSEEYFNSADALVRIDMSEYSEAFTVSRLIGSPPGYVGYGDGGLLTDPVLKHPYSVVLLDEIEKAHPNVFNLMLQLFDDGVLTDSVGRKVNFRNTIVIMTSNAGVSFDMDKQMGFGSRGGDPGKTILEQAKRTFRPEFLGRVDEMIVMNRLTEEDGREIARMMLEKTRLRLEKRDVRFSYDDEVLSLLAKEGVDAMSGARNLRKVILKDIDDPLSDLLLSQPQTRCIVAGTEESEIVLRTEEPVLCGGED